jgi:hypothetical protein
MLPCMLLQVKVCQLLLVLMGGVPCSPMQSLGKLWSQLTHWGQQQR